MNLKIFVFLTFITFNIVFSKIPPKICIIGSGIAGSATAHYLSKIFPDATITVLEK